MLKRRILAFLLALLPTLGMDLADRGKAVFQRRCTGCHAIDHAKGGPAVSATFGRPAASASPFPYSEALRKSGLVWDADSLDRWLADPEAIVPGNDMAFRLEKRDEREAVIAFLRQLSAKRGPVAPER